jgi:hypothetical protein
MFRSYLIDKCRIPPRWGFIGARTGFFRSYYTKEDLNIDEILIDSVREKTSASNKPIFKDKKAEFLIAISFFPLAQSTIAFNRHHGLVRHCLTLFLMILKSL